MGRLWVISIGDFSFKAATALKDMVTAAGIVGGGIWAFFRFKLNRDKETALSIDLTYRTVDYESDLFTTFIDITLVNKGKVHLSARVREPAYDLKQGAKHYYRYGLGLKIRKIPSGLSADSWLDWFGDPPWVETTPEINLLKGYVKAEGTKLRTDFWMEPGESYSLAVPLVLSAGSYLAMVTFIGASEKVEEFWQRIVLIQVPAPSNPPLPAVASKEVTGQQKQN